MTAATVADSQAPSLPLLARRKLRTISAIGDLFRFEKWRPSPDEYTPKAMNLGRCHRSVAV